MDSVDSDLDGANPTTTTTEGDADAIQCKLCGFISKGGITRLKYHVARIKGKGIAICKKASEEDKAVCATLVEKAKEKKKEKRIIEKEMRAEVEIAEEDNAFNVGSKRQKPNNLGPMDKFANPINPKGITLNVRQQNLIDVLNKERTYSVHQYCARWVYEAGIPFRSIDNDGFKKFVEAVGKYGRGYRSPSQYLLREPLLKEEVERTKGLLKKQEKEWAQNDCSVMTDGWTDRKRRSIMNFCVNSRECTTFLSFVECSKEYHIGQFIFDYVDKGIEDVGPQNVIQVVTDDAANNMVATQLLVNKRPSIFWTSYASHTIDLMLEAIGKEDESKKDDGMVSDAVFKCLEKLFHNDFERQDQVSNIELPNEGEEELEEDGSSGVGGEAVGGRELYEDDFLLDEEQVEGGEQLDFNSDEEGFI
nr:putative transcription factor/ chromatin remodeling BED-type(Zn) family [Tanacetum cinerariifolium]